MANLSEWEYKQTFDQVFEWFKQNVHEGVFEYKVYDQEDSHIKVIDIIPPEGFNYRFRVIFGIGYDIILNEDAEEYRTINDRKVFLKFGMHPNITSQKCMCVVKYPDSYGVSHAYLLTLKDLFDEKYQII